MGNDKGFKSRPDAKFQPKPCGGYEGNYNGDTHDFNTKGKSTQTSGSDYHDLGRKNSGLHGNFAEKDASMEYLRNVNKDGQRVTHYSGTESQAVLKTGGGATAYNPMPIPEVYKPVTSQGSVPPNAVQYKTENKDRNESMPYEQVTTSDKLQKKIVKHIKTKE